MKKITTLYFTILCYSIFAQPVLNVSDVNPISVSGSVFSSVNSLVQVSAAGPNQTWNYSSLPLTSQGTSNNNSVATAPYASDFPTSNFYVYSAPDNGNYSYGYYNLTNTKLEVLGVSNDTGIVLTFSNPQTIFEFPFEYNSTFTDNYQITINPMIFSRTVSYDAYGTLTTAFGTFTDVIRFKQVNDNGSINYTWIKLNPYQDLMSASININNTVTYSVLQPIPLSNNQNELKNNFSIYPNPTSGNFSIKNNLFENETFVNIFDILGNQIISNQKIDNNSKEIDLLNFASGMYFVKISDVNNNILQTEKIIKK